MSLSLKIPLTEFDQSVRIFSLPPPDLKSTTKADLINYFLNSWAIEESLFSTIKDDQGFYQSGDPLRHPLIFYFGHTPAFYINKMIKIGALNRGINFHFESLFTSGVDPSTPEEIPIFNDWPSIESVIAYRRKVVETIFEWIVKTPLDLPVSQGSPHWALMMAMEHQRIHFETSSVILRQISHQLLKKPEGWFYATFENYRDAHNTMVPIQPSTTTIGRPDNCGVYGWDNENGKLIESVHPFTVSRFLISNYEYLEFVQDGGYFNEMFWENDGWNWKLRASACHPKFWVPSGTTFLYRAMFDYLPLPGNWPVEVNYHEALAFTRWKGNGFRLLTEAEFRSIAHNNWDRVEANLHLKFCSPRPVDSAQGDLLKVHDCTGNVWQWVSNDFYPLPGFRPDPLYSDFSSPYFGPSHKMMLGGSWATTGTGASPYYRLWFRKHFFQHAGFRVAKTDGQLMLRL